MARATVPLTLHLSPDLVAALDALAREAGTPRVVVIREALREHVARRTRKQGEAEKD